MFAMNDCLTVCGKTYRLIRLLGHGKGGYSYLAECDGGRVVLKQIHHEPCDYYTFGNKIEAECRDYQRLKDAGIRIPAMLAVDIEAERIVKEYIEGKTVFDFVRDGVSVEPYLPPVSRLYAHPSVSVPLLPPVCSLPYSKRLLRDPLRTWYKTASRPGSALRIFYKT